MSIWNKILIGLIIPATLFFFYSAARMMRTQQHWEELAIRLQAQVKDMEEKNRQLQEAEKLDDGSMGIQCLRADLQRMLVNRGRVWEKCEPQRVTPRGEVTVNTDQPSPNGISDKMVLYVFEQGDGPRGGRYLGEFKVTQVGETKVVLAPTLKFSDDEMRRLNASKGPWMLYELMPADRHEVFAELSADEKKALLPDASQVEYLKDGQPADADDPPECKEEGKYKRQLRDYAEIFRTCRAEQTLFVDIYEGLDRDVKYMKEAADGAEQQKNFASREVALLEKDSAFANKERKNVKIFVATLTGWIEKQRQRIEELIPANVKLSADIAKAQLEAARRIDEQARDLERNPGT